MADPRSPIAPDVGKEKTIADLDWPRADRHILVGGSRLELLGVSVRSPGSSRLIA